LSALRYELETKPSLSIGFPCSDCGRDNCPSDCLRDLGDERQLEEVGMSMTVGWLADAGIGIVVTVVWWFEKIVALEF
jgi:hypothetical protein